MRRPTLAAIFLASLLPLAGAAETPAPLRQAALSADLYARGVAAQDPLMILTAARLRKTLDLQPADAASADNPAFTGWQTMLAAALPLIGSDAALTALAEDLAAEQTKGVASGPVYRIADLAGTSRAPVTLVFKGGEYAEVYVEAAPGTDINLYIRDDQGSLICADTQGLHVGYCGWTPAAEGAFTLVVENGAHAATEYTLMTN